MAKFKPPKRLFKSQDRASSYKVDRMGSAGKRLKHMPEEHADVLQNVEFALVTQWKEDPGIDDHHVDRALTTFLDGRQPADRRIEDLLDCLTQVRSLRDDIDDDIWRDAILTVRDSVRRHSSREPGDRAYLQFVKQYVR